MNLKTVEYQYSRLCFKADVIEPLSDDDTFIVHTHDGSFQMTKREFYSVFGNVVKTKSYRERRIYSCKYPPQRALQFLIGGSSYEKPNARHPQKALMDLVDEDIREKIKETGMLWCKSPHNPTIKEEVLAGWEKLIDEWINDANMPLIIRKNIKYRGQSFIHPCGREIIVSDNTFAIWVYGQALKGATFSSNEIKKMLQTNDIPMVFMTNKEVMEKGKYTKPLGADSLPEWKLCHIEPVGFNSNKPIEKLEIEAIKRHFRKYANPSNMFVLPKKIGALGEIDIFIEEQKKRF